MAQIDIPDAVHDMVSKIAEALDVSPGHVLSRLLFGGIKKLPLHPTMLAGLKAQIEAHGKTPTPGT